MDILDQEENQIKLKSLSTPLDRLRHFFIDSIIIIGLTVIIQYKLLVDVFGFKNLVNGDYFLTNLLIVYFLYYMTLETTTGRTLGKYLNKTVLVNNDKVKPKLTQVILRAFLRLVPFQFLSHYTPYNRPLHDILSSTWVLRK